MKRKLQWVAALVLLLPLLYSCATYKSSMTSFNIHIKEQDYQKAIQSIKANKLLKKDRNALLYNLEMGKVYRLQNDYTNSNKYLNVADRLMENSTKSIADVALSNLINPLHQTYFGENYEQYMMHFYKALNYAALGYTEDAVVEARRITIATNINSSRYNSNSNKYSKDAFALNLQGMIYEMAGDHNNAFIAYRNAVQLYQKNNGEYFGVALPLQLEQDLLRAASAIGFVEELKYYENMFNTTLQQTNTAGGSLILFIEDGQAPIKQENNFLLTSVGNALNTFNYTDTYGAHASFNFNNTLYGFTDDKLSSFRTFKLSLPSFAIQSNTAQPITVMVNDITHPTAIVQNMNSIAINVMRERFLVEMGNAMARQLTKKLVEKGTEALAEGVVKNLNNKKVDDTSEVEKKEMEKKKEEKASQIGNIAGLAVNILNTINEKADTRNWQSLPAFVQYVRLPLVMGENMITIKTAKGNKTIKVHAHEGVQMMGIVLD